MHMNMNIDDLQRYMIARRTTMIGSSTIQTHIIQFTSKFALTCFPVASCKTQTRNCMHPNYYIAEVAPNNTTNAKKMECIPPAVFPENKGGYASSAGHFGNKKKH